MEKPTVFTEDDLARIRQGLAGYRVPGAYEPGKWMVSKYTRDERILDTRLPAGVIFRDMTLRVVEQISGVSLSDDDRITFLRAIAATGIASIQPSAFRRGHDLAFMKREAAAIRDVNPDCELVYGGLSTEAELELAAEAGYDAVDVWSTFLGDVAPSCAGAVYHRAWQGREWRDLRFPKHPEDQVARSVRFIELAGKYGIHIGGAVNLLSFCDESYVDLYVRTVAAAGCREVVLADGAGGVSPEVFGHLVGVAKAAGPDVTIGVHTHNNFGTGISAAVESIKAGASLIEVSVNGYEEHPGNPDLATLAIALKALYGVDSGIDLSRMWELARLGEKLTGLTLERNHPVVGIAIYTGGGGDEYVQEHHVDPLIHASIAPEAIGGGRQVDVGVTTGPFTMWDKLDELGIAVDSRETVERVLALCKERLAAADHGIGDDDIRAAAAEVIGQPVASRA
jgi:isopropylmalate/homocitrate/citramalate synthase